MSNADNELLSIFRDEVSEHLSHLNDGLLQVEMIEGEAKYDLLREMNRFAHSMKGAARAVGFGMVETVSHYMEEVFHYALDKGMAITPEVADSLYDGLDLIQQTMDGVESDEAVVASVLSNLEQIVTSFDAGAASNSPDNTRNGDTPLTNGSTPPTADDSTDDDPEKDDKRRTHDSAEIPAIHPDEQAEPATVPDNALKYPEDTDSDLYQLFQQEVSEYLHVLNDGLLQVEMTRGAQRMTLLREMNRLAHSMKGAARSVGFGMIETISHAMEEVFHYALNKGMDLTPEMADTLYDGLDIIQTALDSNTVDVNVIAVVLADLDDIVITYTETAQKIAINETQPARLIPAVDTTDSHDESSDDDSSDDSDAETSPDISRPSLRTSTVEATGLSATTLMRPAEESLRVTVSKLDRLMAEASELIVARMQGEARQNKVRDLRHRHARWQREWRSVRAAYIRLVRRIQEQGIEMTAEMQIIFKFLESNQRYLAEANRELAQLGQILAQDNMQMATLADQIQDNVADLRMMPFETIMGGFQRMIRDLARDTGKQVQLDVTGMAVEIDKTVLDALKEPLMHLLRNSVDHGLETPEERVAAGKSPVGRINLIVEQRGSEMVMRVSDDGRGLDVERIRQRAIERGLITASEAASLSEDDIRMLVFQSGFSTSEKVTSLSGRGLGMDIVRDRVENLRGRVSISSKPGEGTTTVLSVPVSLTRIRAILLRVGDEDYAIPSTMVDRMHTLSRDAIFTAEGQEMITVNRHPMPLASLGTILDTPTGSKDDGNGGITVVVLRTADRTVAFEVDRLYSEMELVLKPLGTELAGAPFVAGATLMGSGDVLIVLDANDLVRHVSGASLTIRRAAARPAPRQQAERRLRVMVVDDSITTRTLEKNILEAVGFEVFVAIDGAEAWSMLAELTPDVIISDVEMPNMNGLELARRVKNDPQTRDIPLVLLTSLSKPEQREAGLQAGADAYLVKSRFDQGELLETIQSVL